MMNCKWKKNKIKELHNGLGLFVMSEEANVI